MSASAERAAPDVTGFHQPRAGAIRYGATDPASAACPIIDPVRDVDRESAATAMIEAGRLLQFLVRRGYRVEWNLDNDSDAGHLSAAAPLERHTGASTASGAQVNEAQEPWKVSYSHGWTEFRADGWQWDRLFGEGGRCPVGSIPARVQLSPGNTLALIARPVGEPAFAHDTVFSPGSGTVRADVACGNAPAPWRPLPSLLSMSDNACRFTGHDHRPGGRAARREPTVAQPRAGNFHLARYRSKAGFVAARKACNRTVPISRFTPQALQMDINVGRPSVPKVSGRRSLKIPPDQLAAPWKVLS